MPRPFMRLVTPPGGGATEADATAARARANGRPPSAPANRDEAINAETLLAVRAQLVHRWFGPEPERRTLAVVSPNRGDGRSWVTAQLGRLFAELDDETLLIDACLQQPSLHVMLGMDNRTGLSSVLSGELEQAPVRAVPGVAHLHLLSAGPAMAAPHKRVAHRNFGLMLERLAARYEAIFVDTPAASDSGDALTLAMRCSGALLVARHNETRVDDLAALNERLGQMTVEVLGAVINEGG